MSDDLEFQDYIYILPDWETVTHEEIKKLLISQFEERGEECTETLWALVRLYSKDGQQDRAVGYVKRLIEMSDDSEEHAFYVFTLGQLMEQMDDYASAKAYYEYSLGMRPCNEDLWYLIHNNLGYSLNQLGQHRDAEPYLKRAISIDSHRPNAYKNLGLACEGLERLREAIECYITATQVKPSDRRSLGHLENLVDKHPSLFTDVPDLQSRLESCREAVQAAQVFR